MIYFDVRCQQTGYHNNNKTTTDCHIKVETFLKEGGQPAKEWNHKESGHRVVTERSQSGHRAVTEWSQSSHRVVTERSQWSQSGHRAVTEWSQSGDRAVTEWSQSSRRVVTEWSQSGHRVVTERPQSGHRAVTERSQSGHRVVTERPQIGTRAEEGSDCSMAARRRLLTIIIFEGLCLTHALIPLTEPVELLVTSTDACVTTQCPQRTPVAVFATVP